MKEISELLERVSTTQAALEKAQADYDQAKQELESSPLLASIGLQVIPLKKGKRTRKPMSEETKAKMRAAWVKRKKAKK
jgi:hypothetical protein